MLTILLVACALVIGFAWGVVLTFKYMVLPARAQVKKVIDMTLENLEKQKKMIEDLLSGMPQVGADGSIVSPIQITKHD